MRNKIKIHLGWFLPTVIALYFGYTAGVSIDAQKIDPALIIALCALFFTYYQFHAVQRHNRLSVKPLIMIGYPFNQSPTIDGRYKIGIVAINTGLGPASIDDFVVLFNEKPITTVELMQMATEATGLHNLYQNKVVNYTSQIQPIFNGVYLKQNSELSILVLEYWSECNSVTHQQLSNIHQKLYSFFVHEIDIQFNYSSIYGDDMKNVATKEMNKKEMPVCG